MKFLNTNTYFFEQDIEFPEWQLQVLNFEKIFTDREEKTWLLYEQDSYLFSILFFGLLAANKEIVLPQNGQVLQIEQSMQQADIFVGSLPPLNILSLDISRYFLKDAIKKTSSHIASHRPEILKEIEFSEKCQITFFTSGSSGKPKAILKTIEQLLLEVSTLEKTFSHIIEGSDKSIIFMSTVSHQHIYGLLFKLLWPIWTGRNLYLKMFQYPEHLVHKIKQYPNNNVVLISSPAYYHRLVADNLLVQIKTQLNSLFSSGGPLNSDVALQLDSELGSAPFEVLGSTETGGIAWRKVASNSNDAWQLFEEIKCKVDDKTERLSIISPYASHEQGREKGDWFVTDDRAEIVQKNLQDKNQRFKLLGRADRIVKIEEKRCSLDEIQARLSQHVWVEQVYVLAIGGKNGKRISTGAVLELSTLGNKELGRLNKFKFDQGLKNYLKDYFEAVVVPRKFRHLKNFPFNSQGKLNKSQLEALFG